MMTPQRTNRLTCGFGELHHDPNRDGRAGWMILYVCSCDTLSKFSRKNGAKGKRLEIMHRVVIVNYTSLGASEQRLISSTV